jgi:glutamate N-acetyltransferase / amino-acid N-acetyltransferase
VNSFLLPAGFSAYGLRCGISNKPGKLDLALFYSHGAAAAAGVCTRNVVTAAPVRLSRKHLRASPRTRAVLVNSGCANACTGPRGDADALASVRAAAAGLGVPAAQVLPASTGVIGRFLPREALEKGVREISALARRGAPGSARDAVRAIMTTDTVEKTAAAKFSWDGRTFSLWGCVKGAGMIHPDMATLISVLLTDAGLPAAALRKDLAWAADLTFNRLSVDGDTSTNDSLYLLANGAAGAFSAPPPGLRKNFRSALREVCQSLAGQVAADGEGATRTAWIFVRGARSQAAAKRFAATAATSALVKTALHGADPNWGRVLAALGRAGEPFDPSRVEVRFGDVAVCLRGQKADYDEAAIRRLMQKEKVVIQVDLHQGRAESHYLTCDYSKDYISINADYTT